MRRTLLIAGMLAAALAACNSSADRAVSDAPGAGQPPNPPKQIVQVHDKNINNPRPTAIDHVSFEGDRSRLRVAYWGGVEDCYGLHHVDQRWEKGVVVITVFTGNKRLPANTACIDIAVSLATIVPLDQEIGTRTVVDGSTGKPVQWRP